MKLKLIIVAIVFIVITVLIGWLLYFVWQSQQQSYDYYNSAAQNISDELNQVPNDFSVEGEIDALDQEIQNF